jgi:hypothetical protein
MVRVFVNKPHTVDDLSRSIIGKIAAVCSAMLATTPVNVEHYVHLYLQAR